MLSVTRDGPITWATLDRPNKMNAMPAEFWEELRLLAHNVESDPETRVLCFKGAGSCFSVGGDIGGFAALDTPARRRAYMEDALSAYRAVEALSKPTIAAVHGFALGGGCELTLVCDLVVADDTSRFGLPEAQAGLVPGLAMVRGLSQMNLHWMKYLVFTGELLNAEESRLAGLVNTVTAPGEHVGEAERLAVLISHRAPLALAVGKRMLQRGGDEGYGYGVEAISLLMGTEDAAEGIAAFTQRRPTNFTGA